jgi:hypothetical protein
LPAYPPNLPEQLARHLLRCYPQEARAAAENPLLQQLRTDPSRILKRAGLTPDPWQARALSSRCRRALWLCSRQAGKSQVAASLALRTALLNPGSLTLLLSPSQRQSAELFRKVTDLFGSLGRPAAVVAESALRLELAGGSRIVSLPGVEATVRSFSAVSLIVIDEAARVEDPLYFAVRPMLAVSRGRLVGVSSAWAKQGWFYTAWESGDGWERTKVTAPECPRISRAFLEEERRALGPRWYSMEYLCEFGDAVDAVFRTEDIEAAFTNDLKPLIVDRANGQEAR